MLFYASLKFAYDMVCAVRLFSVLQSGSAHYHCKVQAVGSSILVKNPRDELYKHSRAQSFVGTECTTSHILDNQVIEISDCDIVSF